MAIVLVIVVLPLLVRGLPREIAAWHLAAALEAETDDDLAVAEKHVGDALRWYPESASALRLKALLLHRGGKKDEALTLASAAMRLEPASAASLNEQLTLLHRLGRHKEALAVWKQLIAAPSQPSLFRTVIGLLDSQDRASAAGDYVNGFAYFRALANEEVDVAIRELKPFTEMKRDPNTMMQWLDTLGFLLFQQGKYEQARVHLDASISLLSQAQSQAEKRTRQGVHNARELQRAQKLQRMTEAVIRYHRGATLEKLGENKLAEQDFQRVRELGFTPDENLY